MKRYSFNGLFTKGRIVVFGAYLGSVEDRIGSWVVAYVADFDLNRTGMNEGSEEEDGRS